MSRYKYIHADNLTICLSTYGGKTVRGVARCAPGDEYDQEYGERLAKARCDVRVAQKRFSRAMEKYNEASKAVEAAEEHEEKMADYLDSADEELYNATDLLESIIAEKVAPGSTTIGDALGEDE